MDTVVIGASISGLMFAKHLGLLGTKCLVLEKEKGVGGKPCGEGIDDSVTRASSFFYLYGSEAGIERQIDRVVLRYRDYKVVTSANIITIDRKKVERELLHQTLDVGADVRFNEKVSHLERTRDGVRLMPQGIEARVLVGADGVDSITRGFMGLRKPATAMALTTQVRAKADEATIKFEKNFFGYHWIFPKSRTCNVGVGEFSGKWDNLRQRLDSFLSENGLKCGEIRGAQIPISSPKKFYYSNIIVVAVSASQVCSLTGGGIPSSSQCAAIAARVVHSAVKNNNFSLRFLRRYELLCRREVYPTLWARRLISRMLFIAIKSDRLMKTIGRIVF